MEFYTKVRTNGTERLEILVAKIATIVAIAGLSYVAMSV